MCDEQTEAENDIGLANRGLRRRELGLGATAVLVWLDIGTTGYCMGGSFTFRTAVAVPERVGALGSTEAAWSPRIPRALTSCSRA